MKKLLLAAAAAIVAISTMSAYAYNCRTTCYWVGEYQYCNQTCN